jgi:hypothetical protein
MKARNQRMALIGAGLLFVCGLAIFFILLRYTGDLRSLTAWKRLHSASIFREGKVVGAAWVYANRSGDYLVLTEESPNYGPYLLRSGEKLVADCAWKPMGQTGARYIWTPVYVRGWSGCLSMDGFKFPETKATVSDTSIDFSSPDHWRPEDIGNFRVAW